jgi:hypothetical protein
VACPSRELPWRWTALVLGAWLTGRNRRRRTPAYPIGKRADP